MVELSEFASILLLSVKKRSCLSLSTTFQIQLNRTTACLEYPCVYAGKSWLYGTALQYSCLENPMDGGAWWAAVHGVAQSRRRLSDFTFTFMHWRRKWQPSPVFLPGESQGWGSLMSMGSCRVRHDWSDSAAAAAAALKRSNKESTACIAFCGDPCGPQLFSEEFLMLLSTFCIPNGLCLVAQLCPTLRPHEP